MSQLYDLSPKLRGIASLFGDGGVLLRKAERLHETGGSGSSLRERHAARQRFGMAVLSPACYAIASQAASAFGALHIKHGIAFATPCRGAEGRGYLAGLTATPRVSNFSAPLLAISLRGFPPAG